MLTATNGAKALEMIQTEKPDLVFLGVMMPKMNGFEVCQAVKSDVATQVPYIVMLTAKGQEFDQNQGREVGADLSLFNHFQARIKYSAVGT